MLVHHIVFVAIGHNRVDIKMVQFPLCTSVPCATTFDFQAFGQAFQHLITYEYCPTYPLPILFFIPMIRYHFTVHITLTYPEYPRVHYLHYMRYIIIVPYIQVENVYPKNPLIIHYMQHFIFQRDPTWGFHNW